MIRNFHLLMLDRIDIHIEVPRLNYDKLSNDRLGELSAVIRGRVQTAREKQLQRFSKSDTAIARNFCIVCNADMRVAEARQFCPVPEPGLSQIG